MSFDLRFPVLCRSSFFSSLFAVVLPVFAMRLLYIVTRTNLRSFFASSLQLI